MRKGVPQGFTLIEIVTVISIFAILSGIIIANLRDGKNNQILREASQRLVDDMRDMQNKTVVGTTLGVCHEYDTAGTPIDETDDIFVAYWEDCDAQVGTCSGPAVLPAEHRVVCKEKFPPGGYGVFFDASLPDMYTKFADFDEVLLRNNVTGVPVYYEGAGKTDSEVLQIDLPQYVEIAGVSVSPQFDQNAGLGSNPTCYPTAGGSQAAFPGASPTDVSLAWIPPNGIMYTIFHTAYVADTSGICPDYIVHVMLRHTKIDKCRTITLNGASGLIDEKSDPSCTLP